MNLGKQYHLAEAHNTCGEMGLERKIQDWIMKVLKRYFKMIGLLPMVNEIPLKTLREKEREKHEHI